LELIEEVVKFGIILTRNSISRYPADQDNGHKNCFQFLGHAQKDRTVGGPGQIALA